MSPPDSNLVAVAPVYSDASNTSGAPPSRRALRLGAVIVGGLALLVVVGGLITRAEESAQLRDWTEAQAVPTVAVATPGDAAAGGALNLPGRLEAYSRAPIYARVSGYLKSWKYDIGAQVKAGALLAEIDAPDLDQQLAQAEADLSTAQANLTLSSSTAQRWQSMLGTNAVSKQEVDEKTGDLAAKQA
ncbi:MAG TPA: biotin/lipoyl-binding protein, partial [Steroidobacteraceae bacterium]